MFSLISLDLSLESLKTEKIIIIIIIITSGIVGSKGIFPKKIHINLTVRWGAVGCGGMGCPSVIIVVKNAF